VSKASKVSAAAKACQGCGSVTQLHHLHVWGTQERLMFCTESLWVEVREKGICHPTREFPLRT